jgi:hypothetical protein
MILPGLQLWFGHIEPLGEDALICLMGSTYSRLMLYYLA